MVPFLDLKAQYQNIKGEVDSIIVSVLESGQFVQGRNVAEFEKDFSRFCDSQYGVAVNSGTSALHLALLTAGVGEGDEVITVPLTFVATTSAICYTGARPIFVDVDPTTHNMDVTQIEAAITKKTKAILPVHLHGQPADMAPIVDLARRYKLVVIEDAAQAHGAVYKGTRVGSLGDLACFSFYPGKNLGAYGEGGMVVTNRLAYANKLRLLRDCGQERKYHHVIMGYNYRMSEIQGAVLGFKLKYLKQWTNKRRQNARYYHALMEKEGVDLPKEMKDREHVFHVYAIRTERRDALQSYLLDQGIQTGIHYPIPVHLQEGFRGHGYKKGDFPVSESYAHSTLSLPMYPELQASQMEEVADAVRDFSKVFSLKEFGEVAVGGPCI